MSLTTLRYKKTHERDYSADRMPSTLAIENTVKATPSHRIGGAEYERAGDDAGIIALDGRWGKLPDNPTLVSDAVGLGCPAVGGDKGAFTGPEWGLSTGRR